jgi:hypothetical protein
MSSKERKAINFRLSGFEVKSYSFQKPEETIRKDRIGYGIQFMTGGDLDKELFWFDIKATGQYGKKNPIVLGEIVTRSIFLLEGIKNFVNEDGEITMPDHLATTLLSISYSTTRGAMAVKSEGNILSEVIMPLIEPKKLLESGKPV